MTGDYRMRKIICIILTVLIIGSLTSCKGDDSENQVIYYNLEKSPTTLDPQISDTYYSQMVVKNLFEGLTLTDENDKVLPGVAKSWDISKDGLEYVFHLRENASWSDEDATEVTADDFVYGIQRTLDPAMGSTMAENLYMIKNARSYNKGSCSESDLGIEAVSKRTLRIRLEYPDADFLRVLSTVPTMPCNRKFFDSTQGQYGLTYDTIMGNGPFELKGKHSWSYGSYIKLSKSESYKGSRKPIAKGLTFWLRKDVSDAIKSISDGEVDAAPLSIDQLDEARENNFNITSFADQTWGLCFNLSDKLMKNSDIRIGLIKGIDRGYALSELPSDSAQTRNIVPDLLKIKGVSYRKSTQDDFLLTQSSNAGAYIENGLKSLNLKSLPTVTIICLNDSKTKSIINNCIEKWNKNLGYYFNIEPLSNSELMERVSSREYQIALAPVISKSENPIDFLSMFKSGSEDNIFELNSSEYDLILNTINNKDVTNQIKSCLKAERFLHQNAVFYPMYTGNTYFASAPNVTGVVFYPYNGGVDFISAKKVKK